MNNQGNPSGDDAMDIDPVDDGPKQDTPMMAPPLSGSPPVQIKPVPITITQEEEARRAIEMLRGDDVANRVSAANRLDAVAAALGEERSREVGDSEIVDIYHDFLFYCREF